MKLTLLLAGLVSLAQAHTTFSTLFVNGKNQGDGKCIRMSKDIPKATYPISSINSDDMACGVNGNDAVDFICPSPGEATLTFEFRSWPDGGRPGPIDWSHHGALAVYVKKVSNMFSDPASGPGWFKIWDEGYDTEREEWAVDRLIKNQGLLSVELPQGLPSGYYLIRTEVLALHNATNGDPQFFVGCAQLFIEDGPDTQLEIPKEHSVSIPGYMNMKMPGLTWNLYRPTLPPYPIPGPKVYRPTDHKDKTVKGTQKEGLRPSNCLIRNGNWCAKPVPAYSDATGCWASVKDCYNQVTTCWAVSPPTGGMNCWVWNNYCKLIDNYCSSKKYTGPPKILGAEVNLGVPGPIPKPYLGTSAQGSSQKQVEAGSNNVYVDTGST